MDRRPAIWRYTGMRILAFLLGLCLAGPVWTQTPDLEVDVELFLAVDVSRSMSAEELEIQRRGYAEALASDEVFAAIRRGPIGRIAVTYVEWAGSASHRVIVPWTLIETRDQAIAAANQITAHFDGSMRRTSITQALLYAADDFDDNGFAGLRRVIDVSGDGPNNQGGPVEAARDAVLAQGITINGIPLMTRDELSIRWGIDDLDEYYRRCVIGGPGSFVIPVLRWDQFAEAVRRKLVLEIAGGPVRLYHAQARQLPPYNCLIGEQIWERNQFYFNSP